MKKLKCIDSNITKEMVKSIIMILDISAQLMGKRKSLIMYVSVVALFLGGCTAPKQESILSVQLHKDLTIEDSSENLYQNFAFIRTLDVDLSNNIYVLDKNKILKFDKFGKFLWVLEQKGQGPGEFQRIVDLALGNDGRLYAADQNQRKIVVFSDVGKYLSEFKVEGGSPIRLAVDSKNFIYLSFMETTGNFLLHKYSPQGKRLHSFMEADKNDKDPQLKRARNSILFCVDNNDDVVVTFQYNNTILKYSPDGKLKARWTQPLPFKPKKLKIESPNPGWRQVVGDLINQDIAVDRDNLIYVIWGSKITEKGFRIDIFSPDGEYLSSFYPGVKPLEEWQYFHIDHDNNLYVIDPITEPKIFRFTMKQE